MKSFLYTILMSSILVGLCFNDAMDQKSLIKIYGVSGEGDTDITLTFKEIDSEGDSTRQTVWVHLLVKNKNVTKLNYIHNEASINVVGTRVLVIDLQGMPLPDDTCNPEADRGLSLPTKGLGTLQVFFNRAFDLNEPIPGKRGQHFLGV